MSSFKKFVLSNLAETAVPLLKTPIEDVVYDTLDRRQLPSRSEIRELTGRLARLQEAVEKLNTTAAALQSADSAAPVEPPELVSGREELGALRARVDEAQSAASEARSAVDALAAAPVVVSVAEAVPVEAASSSLAPESAPAASVPPESVAPESDAPTSSAPRRGRPRTITPDMRCAVEGCDGAVRSKVFCARHYQQWRRNRLEGFVSPNGTVVWQGVRYSFDKRFACEPVKVTLDGDRVIYEVNGRTYKKKASVAVIGEVRRRRTSKS